MFNTNYATAPTTYNLTICGDCNAPAQNLDILFGAAGTIDPSTLQIIDYPTKDTLSVGNGTISYAVNGATTGANDSFTYKVANYDGDYSNTSTVTVNRYCPGLNRGTTRDITCSSQSFNLEDLLGGLKTAGTWAEYTSSYGAQGGIITNPNGGVNFTSINPGTYTFRKTINTGSGDLNCPIVSTVDISIIKRSVPYPSNNTCVPAKLISYLRAVDPVTTSITNESNESACPIKYGPTLSGTAIPPSWNTNCSGDLFYKFITGTTPLDIYVTVGGGTMVNPQVAVYIGTASNTCESLTLVSDAAETSGGTYVATNPPTLLPGRAYWIRVTSGGTGNEGTFNVYLSTDPLF